MSTTPSESNIFKCKKTLTAFRHFGEPDCFLLCEECEENRATVSCLICEQNQCENCNVTIHNKGKRAQHTRQLIKMDSKQSLKVFFVSLNSFKEVARVSATDQDIGIKFIDFIRSALEINKIANEEAVIYIYYFSDVSISQELISKLCIHTDKLKYCFFMDVNKASLVNEVKNVQFNKEVIPMNDEKVLTLAKCFSAISKGYKHVYIYDQKNATQLGFLILAAENSELSGTQKVFVSENQAMKLEELTPKKTMKLMNMGKQEDKQTTESAHRGATSEDLSSELYSKLGIQSGFFFDNSQGSQQHSLFKTGLSGDFKGFSNEEAPYSQTFSRVVGPERRNEPFGISLGDPSDNRRFNISDFSDQFYQRSPGTSLQGGSQQSKTNPNIKQSGSNVMIRQPMKELEVDGSLELGRYIQSELYKLAIQGDLVLLKERFAKIISETVTKKFNRKTSDVLDKANQVGILHTTVRTYADGQIATYIGLQLEIITVESLGWIVRSIKKDAMAPTEKLVLSRIKECFALKLSADTWKNLLNYLLEYQCSNKKLPVGDTEGIVPFKISQMPDPSTGADTYVIGIQGEEWSFDDIGTVDETSPSWKEFMKFLDDFFDEEEVEKSKSQKKGDSTETISL